MMTATMAKMTIAVAAKTMSRMSDTSFLEKDGKTLLTAKLQSLLDEADEFVFLKGDYLSGPLFLHSDMKVKFEAGARIHLIDDESMFFKISTRIAGIDMEGYPALLNLIDVRNVVLSGHGEVIGHGSKWYRKYWGDDKKGGMRKEYDAKGLRFACDYDCSRPKNILVQNSEDVNISDLTLRDSPFWNLHVLYSKNIVLDGLCILADDPDGPSTDGIDIDSSQDVEISHCSISTNDDCISLKSGRDQDGIDRGIPTKHVHIHDCSILHGYGISIGSELSAGIEDVLVENVSFSMSDCGFRIKSSKNRKGYVRNVLMRHVSLKDVRYPFYCYLDWNRMYNANVLPEDYKGVIPPYWKKLLACTDPMIKDTCVENLSFEDVSISYQETPASESCLYTFNGFENGVMAKIRFSDIRGVAGEYGTFANCRDVVHEKEDVRILHEDRTVPGSFDNR